MEPKRVVITGIGAVSPFGVGREIYWQGLKEGRSGLRKVTLFKPNGHSCRVAAEANNFDPEAYLNKGDHKRVSRVVPMAISAAREAAEDALLDVERMPLSERQNIEVIIGSGGGGIEYAERQYESFYNNRKHKINPYAVSSSFVGTVSSEISIDLGLKGQSHVISTGCTSSTDAMGYALSRIRFGQGRVIITGGADACITPAIIAGFCRMKAVATSYNDEPERASRPFDIDREGFILGEGSWMLVFEELGHAVRRDAKIYAEVKGYGSTCDAYHRVMTTPDGTESARAMVKAIEDAGLEKKDIDYVNLHGTSTRMNDLTETKAVKLAFNGRYKYLATSAAKSMIGHPQGACGAASVTATVMALKDGFIHPTINYENPDPECNLDYTPNKGVEKDTRAAVCNTIAFGSKNSALVLKRYKEH